MLQFSQSFLSWKLLNTQEENLLTAGADDNLSDGWWTPDNDENDAAINKENNAPINRNIQR